jgi:hypothetical protein
LHYVKALPPSADLFSGAAAIEAAADQRRAISRLAGEYRDV